MIRTSKWLNLQYETQIENGKKHGVERIFMNGVIFYENTYVNGVINGVVRAYHKNGNLRRESIMFKQKIVGYDKFFNLDGVMTSERTFAK